MALRRAIPADRQLREPAAVNGLTSARPRAIPSRHGHGEGSDREGDAGTSDRVMHMRPAVDTSAPRK